ncbi:aspartate/glutamate/uridylate kinase [Haloterrigena turkmenica DSM 5511]|uniref:Isopentenyl phosphate kinase n=1 Tax=Haloterrigena turkmenica (strain ATCC 51198 / DSM 5511 / JCM 9101 / NCIMB 13204 / VKM B-1734 / 4k) TaxID=543526 RepID=D2RVY8_HALTV|nr:isopentenyl phosphate kinase [Haloterrigena turkmenica]ADB61417.1 aspartate/glutamate/uridylate kinase [Haloterrigena turkmenica DSM 5511]
MIVLKLGGSVITDKDRPETLDGEALERAADAVAAALDGDIDDLVVVHGGGSFGHHNASEHGVTTTEGTRDAGAALDIHGAMTTLNRFVLGRLLERGVEAVPVHPFSAAHRDAESDLELPTGQVATLLAEGFVPVLHGDLVAHAGAGATVVSGDELVAALARDLEAERIGLCSTVPGVLDDEDRVIDRISDYDDVEAVLGESEATDVTGGMAAKVQALLALEAEASIFGLEELDAFLAGDESGTTIDSSET